MTTIAYRDGVMAAEGLITSGGMRCGIISRKMAKSPQGHVAGAAGSMAANVAFLNWIEAGLPEDKPSITDDNFDALVVEPDGTLNWIGKDLIMCAFDAPFAATGSGERYAMAAMEMGAGAERALEVAMKLDTGSGGEIKVLKLGAAKE